jgi:hypothetical protein
VTVGLTTWRDAGGPAAAGLLIVNSDAGAYPEVERALERFSPLVNVLCVVAPRSWRDWLRQRGIADDRQLLATDADDNELELNYFLGSAEVLEWTTLHSFDLIAGTSPHNLYNEEVKRIFEQRVAVFLTRGRLIAHTLPEDYLYVLDLPSVMIRLGRGVKIDDYRDASCRLVADLYALWRSSGSPPVSDEADFTDVIAVLRDRLGEPLLRFDERERIPLRYPDAGARAAADLVVQLSALVRARGSAYLERANAVIVRDDIIDRLHDEAASPIRRLGRWLSKLGNTDG